MSLNANQTKDTDGIEINGLANADAMLQIIELEHERKLTHVQVVARAMEAREHIAGFIKYLRAWEAGERRRWHEWLVGAKDECPECHVALGKEGNCPSCLQWWR